MTLFERVFGGNDAVYGLTEAAIDAAIAAGKAVVSSLSGSPLPKRSPPGYPGLSANSGYLFP